MAVINAIATDYDYRVANFTPCIFKLLQFRVFKIEQEHHFVTQLADIN